jgi:hypothetical protein
MSTDSSTFDNVPCAQGFCQFHILVGKDSQLRRIQYSYFRVTYPMSRDIDGAAGKVIALNFCLSTLIAGLL